MFYHRQMLGYQDKIADKGFVVIFYNVGPIKLSSLYRQVPPMFVRADASLPTSVACTHFCFSNPLFRILAENTLRIMGSEKRAATKIHQGKSRFRQKCFLGQFTYMLVSCATTSSYHMFFFLFLFGNTHRDSTRDTL